MQVNQRQSVELQGLSKQSKLLDDSVTYLNKQLVKHIQEKHECQKRLEELQLMYGQLNDQYECIRREHKAVSE